MMQRLCPPFLLLVAALLLPGHAAGSCDAPSSPPPMSESVFRAVESAADDITEGREARAIDRLGGLVSRLRGYERAVVLQTLGYAHAQADDFPAALKTFAEALELDALPPEPQQQLRYNTGQLQLSEGDSEAGLRTLEQYMEEACTAPPPHAHMLLATAYVDRARYRDALQQVRQARQKSEPMPEEWLRFQLGLHFELKEFAAAADVLVELLIRAPRNESYWQQLVGVYYENRQLRRALAASVLSERLGLINDARNVRNLAMLYQALDIPFKAGQLLDDAIQRGVLPRDAEELERLANAWIRAREWASAEPALHAAAEASGRSSLHLRLGQVRVERGRYAEAVAAFAAALERGVDKPAQVHYQMGIAAWRAGDAVRARNALQQALRDSSQRAAAQQWLDFIDQAEAG